MTRLCSPSDHCAPSATSDGLRTNLSITITLIAIFTIFSVRGYRAEQPVRLAVDPVREIEDIRTPVVAAYSECDCPKAARAVAACVDPEPPTMLPVDGVERVDLAMEKAEVADQQMTAETAETGRCQGDPPRRSEPTADDQLFDEVAVFIENRHSPCTQSGADLVGTPGGRIGHVNVAGDVLHIEGRKPSR